MDSAQTQKRRHRGILGPLVLILVGVVLLLERNDVIARHTLWQWLPLLPIFIGGSLLATRRKHNSD